MIRIAKTPFAVACIAVVGLFMSACQSKPDPTYTFQDLQKPAVRKAAASHYWSLYGDIPYLSTVAQRIAIAEFTVEFVTQKLEPPIFDDQQYDNTIPKGPHHPGVTKRTIQVDPRIYPQLVEDCYVLFVKQCRQRGLEAIASDDVKRAYGFREIKKIPGPQTQIYQYDSTASPDVGWATEIHALPARGLGIMLGSSWSTVDAQEVAILHQTGSSAVIRVRMRIGLHRGHATLERDSKIKIVTASASGLLVAQRSVISDNKVVVYDPADLHHDYTEQIDVIDPDQYAPTIRRIFPTFIALALDAWPSTAGRTHLTNTTYKH